MSRARAAILAFAVGVAGVFAALTWITWHVLRLERAEHQARADARVEERVRLALWRLDSYVVSFLAKEAARPYFEYQPFFPSGRAYSCMLLEARPGENLVPSPLLGGGDPVARLYFQRDVTGAITSPQTPSGHQRELAQAAYLDPAALDRATTDLELLGAALSSQEPWNAATLGNSVAHDEVAIGLGRPLSPIREPVDQAGGSLVEGRVEESRPGDASRSSRGVWANPATPAATRVPPSPSTGAAPAPSARAQIASNDYSARLQTARQVVDNAQRPTSTKESQDTRLRRLKSVPTIAQDQLKHAAEHATPSQESSAMLGDASDRAPSEGFAAPPHVAVTGAKVVDKQPHADEEVRADATMEAAANRADEDPLERELAALRSELLDKVRPDLPGRADREVASVQAPPAPEPIVGMKLIRPGGAEPPAATPAPAERMAEAASSSLVDATFGAFVEGVELGPFTPSWIPIGAGGSSTGHELLLIRAVRAEGSTASQGIWVDWGALERELRVRIADLLPQATLHPALSPASESNTNRRLASIPVELAPGLTGTMLAGFVPAWSPMRTTLVLAWLAVLLAILVIAFVLRAATDLAERRGRFVSAVTHELRTPLTTFCLYSQMLADGMVPEGEARREYLSTLKSESGRLAGIVESVLEYARLGRRPAAPQRARLSAADLVDRLEPVLRRRTDQCAMDLVIDAPREALASATLLTDPGTVERILVNLVDNACKYAADATTRRVDLAVRAENGSVRLIVSDHGPGIREAERARVFRPFYRGHDHAHGSTPGLGLGLALARGLAEQLNGRLELTRAAPAEFTLTLPTAPA